MLRTTYFLYLISYCISYYILDPDYNIVNIYQDHNITYLTSYCSSNLIETELW